MRSFLFAAAISLCGLPSFAQDAKELATQYNQLPAVQEMMTAMFSPETSAQQFKATLPPGVDVSDEKLLKVGQIMSDVLIGLKPEMEEMQIEAIADVFTVEEIEAMIEFYSSDIGASVLVKTQPMFTSVMTELTPKIQAAMGMRQQEIIEIMSE